MVSRVYWLFFALTFPAGIPTQVVVPSVSLAAVPQGTDLTVFVETPSSATLSKPVVVPGSNGPPTGGAEPAIGTVVDGVVAGGGVAAGGDPTPAVSGICCANAAGETSASEATNEKVMILIGASS
jgi:hypothetical protein